MIYIMQVSDFPHCTGYTPDLLLNTHEKRMTL